MVLYVCGNFLLPIVTVVEYLFDIGDEVFSYYIKGTPLSCSVYFDSTLNEFLLSI